MKVALLFALSVLYAQMSMSQTSDSGYVLDSAFSNRYNEVYIQNHPKADRGYIMASHMSLQNYSREKDTANLIKFCHSVLDRMPFTPLIKNGQRSRQPELFDMLANQAADTLSKIFEQRKNIDSALHYLSLADTSYGYVTRCGNDHYTHRIVNARRYANLYKAKGDTNAAMNALLKEALNREHSHGCDLQKLLPYLSAYNKQQLKKELNKAITDFRIDKKGTQTEYYIIFMNVKCFFWVDDYDEPTRGELRMRAIKSLKQSPFYKMVMAM